MDSERIELERLATEARNDQSARLDTMSPAEIVALMVHEERHVQAALEHAQHDLAHALDAIEKRLARGGRLVYCGAGTSGRLGVLDAAECPPTFSTAPGQVLGLIAGGERAFTDAVEGAEDREEAGTAEMESLAIGERDAVVGIAASGRTPWVLGALGAARHRGALTIAIVCTRDAPLAKVAEITITLLVGPEVLTGSTRLKAGTATKCALNILSTGAFVRLGKAYSNLMVDVQCTNEKLKARARRIVAQAAGCSESDANELLRRCGGETKTAIVAALKKVTPDDARRLLAAQGGHVRRALA